MEYKKLVFKLSPLILIGMLFAFCDGCATKVQYLENSEAFNMVKDKTFILQQDSYVIRFADCKKGMQQIACNPGVPGVGLALLPKRGDTNLIGKLFRKKLLIDDMIPKGTTFRVVALRREDRVEIGRVMAFEIVLDGRFGQKWPRLDARWLTNNHGSEPEIFPECATPAPK